MTQVNYCQCQTCKNGITMHHIYINDSKELEFVCQSICMITTLTALGLYGSVFYSLLF